MWDEPTRYFLVNEDFYLNHYACCEDIIRNQFNGIFIIPVPREFFPAFRIIEI